ncbi:MAG: hypothetical protein JW849_10765 [Phycisphaerae bacterium]|nr:hypothetical protein [Phycisphaerae bacterium]
MILQRTYGKQVWRLGVFVFLGVVGCLPESHVHDAKTLVSAKRVAVMPVVRPEGIADGGGQAGVLMTELAAMDYYDVEGVGRFRRALKKAGEANDPALQQTVAEKLHLDALGVCEVTDYRWTTSEKGAWYVVGTASWTECTYHVSVQIRLTSPDGKVLYTGRGTAESKEGYGPATLQATRKALALLRNLTEKAKRDRKEASGA